MNAPKEVGQHKDITLTKMSLITDTAEYAGGMKIGHAGMENAAGIYMSTFVKMDVKNQDLMLKTGKEGTISSKNQLRLNMHIHHTRRAN